MDIKYILSIVFIIIYLALVVVEKVLKKRKERKDIDTIDYLRMLEKRYGLTSSDKDKIKELSGKTDKEVDEICKALKDYERTKERASKI